MRNLSLGYNRQADDASTQTAATEHVEFVSLGCEATQQDWDTIELQPIHNPFQIENSCGKVETTPVYGNDVFYKISAMMPDLQKLSSGARKATRAEQRMTFLKAVRRYPKAIAWSILLSCTIIMEGYDTMLINSYFTFPAFQRKFGELVTNSNGQQVYNISATWQSCLTIGASGGEIMGLFINGLLADRFGYRRTMLGALIFLSLGVFISFFAVNIEMLLMGQIACGVPWGVFQTLSTTYASEMMPVTLRAYLLSNVNMCWLLGQLIGAGVLRGFADMSSNWSYRVPFALQWSFAVPMTIAVFFAPESPWWLIRHGRPAEARKTLLRLTSTGQADGFNVDETIAMMQHTNEVEKCLSTGGMSYLDCFRQNDLRRTEITCGVWVSQQMSGSSLTGYAAYFYEQAGLAINNVFNLTLGMYGLAILAGTVTWFLLPHIGRRRLYLFGLLGTTITLSVTGVISLFSLPMEPWIVGSLLIAMTFVYDLTLGPVCYVLVAEIPSTRLRVKTVVLARVAYNLANIVTNAMTPRMLNPTAWDWKGKAAFFYAATALACLLWCYFRLPELIGLSYLEIDILFEKRAKTSKFHELQTRLASSAYCNISKLETQAGMWKSY